MKRSDLVEKLKLVQPALSSNPIVPMLCQFWFTGERLMAYNDQIALAVPLQTAFKGAVSEKLLHLLEASHFDEMELMIEDNALKVKRSGGKVVIKLEMTAPEFLFTMPEPQGTPPNILPLIRAVDHCLMSVGTDTSKPEYLGVTIVSEGDGERLGIYSTDGNTISRARIKSDGITFPRSILPGEFCRQVVSLFGTAGEDARLGFEIASRDQEQYALFTVDETILYGRIIATSSPLNFSNVLASLVPSRADNLVAIPDQFNGAVERACIVCDHDRGHATVRINDGKMHLRSQTEGEADVEDSFPIDRSHPSVAIKVEPKLLKRGGSFDKLLIRDTCVVMAKGNRLYLIACHN